MQRLVLLVLLVVIFILTFQQNKVFSVPQSETQEQKNLPHVAYMEIHVSSRFPVSTNAYMYTIPVKELPIVIGAFYQFTSDVSDKNILAIFQIKNSEGVVSQIHSVILNRNNTDFPTSSAPITLLITNIPQAGNY